MPLTIRWSLHGHGVGSDADSTLGIETSQAGPRANFLSIPSVGHRHSGVYTCTASNNAGTSSWSTELKVNGEADGSSVANVALGTKGSVGGA